MYKTRSCPDNIKCYNMLLKYFDLTSYTIIIKTTKLYIKCYLQRFVQFCYIFLLIFENVLNTITTEEI